MSRRRGQALVVLLGFVVATSVVTGVLVGGALWAADGRQKNNESHSAAASSVAVSESATATSAAPASAPGPDTAPPPTSSAGAAVNPPADAVELHKNAEEGRPSADIAAGDCVGFGGENGAIQKSACGTSGADFRVTSVAEQNTSCPADSDRTFTRTLPGGGDQDTLCLDVPWAVGGCVDVNGVSPRPAACATTPAGRVRVVDIKQGTSDVNVCAGAGDRGFVYAQRRFVVCAARL
ncbi:hypothetical protein [Nocardia sp. alder85J]|uniref:LppU/SCO3897 family protein n=1 Tax=Nocardia sp. alder85J TaxID=2862949 RepID=UPI001CD1EE85|nr:hypothetical protein [Nocardia sp. alder85J]MCX4093778.1 hypothetical protein [Nocardia sp. alder85J]